MEKRGISNGGAARNTNTGNIGPVKEYRGGLSLNVPLYIEDTDYRGEEMGTRLRCRHGFRPQRRAAWEGADTGRRFLGCPLEEEEQCDTLIWVDDPWHPRVQSALEHLWNAIEHGKKNDRGTHQSAWCCFAEKSKLEEEKMKLELDMADRLMAVEVASKKRLARKIKELDETKSC